MPPNPENIQKYLYIERTPTWKVRALYLFGIFSWLVFVYGISKVFLIDPFFHFIVGPIIAVFTLYHLLSFGINLFYCQYNLSKHFKFVEEFWPINKQPSVDIFLPICGEDAEVLCNTWEHVSKLYYKNKKVYVLDDSIEGCEQHKKLAEQYGFNYIERPNKGEMKKAGNLKYAFERTNGDFIAIFDADFAPHHHFLIETIPYMNDSSVGIVQTPQYFETTPEVYKHSPLAYTAAYQDEFFYRIIQVAKNRLNAAICCGSNAVYRRQALKAIGGPRQVTASEDSRTGFALLSKGWITRYVPIILAVGICPNNLYTYYHQQHRWCRGRSELVLSKEFITAPVSLIKKLCNVTGFLSFLLRPLEILLSFQLFWLLFLYNEYISFGNAIIFYLYLFFSFFLLPLFHIARFKKEVFLTSTIQTYTYTHSIISVMMRKTVDWISTNAKYSEVSPAFLQIIRIIVVYVSLYLFLIILAVRTGDIHFLNYNYWSIQFWIFWNLALSTIILWQFANTVKIIKNGNGYLLNYLSGKQRRENTFIPAINKITTYSETISEKNYFLQTAVLLGFILGVSFILRFHQIGKLSFWQDELFTTRFINTNLKDSILLLVPKEVIMGFYYLLANFWSKLFPIASEGSLRSLSAIFSIISIPVVFLLGKETFLNKKKAIAVGLIASLLIAVNAYHIQYAQEFRSYSLVFLLTALSTFLLIKAVEKSNSVIRWLSFVIVSIIAIYSHLFAVIILIAQAMSLIYLCWKNPRTFPYKGVILSYIFTVFLTVPLIMAALAQGSSQIGWIPGLTLKTIGKFLYNITGMQSEILTVLYIYLTLGGLGVAFLKANQVKNDYIKWKLMLMTSCLFLPIIMTVVISLIKPIFLNRYLLFVMPYLAIFASCSIVYLINFERWKSKNYIGISLLALIIILSFTGVNNYYKTYQKENYRGATQFMSNNCSESLIIYYPQWISSYTHFYNSNLVSQVPWLYGSLDKSSDPEYFVKRLPSNNKQACLMLGSLSPGTNKQKNQINLIRAALQMKYPNVSEAKFNGLEVDIYKK